MSKREKLVRIVELMESNDIEKGEAGQFIRIHLGEEDKFTFADGMFGDHAPLGDDEEIVEYLDANEDLIIPDDVSSDTSWPDSPGKKYQKLRRPV